MSEIRCGKCSAPLAVGPMNAGQRMRCPQCGRVALVHGPNSRRVAPNASLGGRGRFTRRHWLLAGAGLAALLVSAAGWLMADRHPDVQHAESNFRQSTDHGGNEETSSKNAHRGDALANPVERGNAPPVISLADLIERLDDGVVAITAKDKNGRDVAAGSGFVIDPAGLVATNYHLVAAAEEATLRFHDGSQLEVAGVRACDPAGDLVILAPRGTPPRMEVLSLNADAAGLRPGADVVALGHPRGLQCTARKGIVSAVRPTSGLPEGPPPWISAPAEFLWIQTTAVVPGGGSGGPLLDDRGRVIGVSNWAAEQELAFAAHARHLAALRQNLNDAPVPLREFNRRRRSKQNEHLAAELEQQLQQLTKQAEAFRWKPSSTEDFQQIGKLAEAVWTASSKDLLLEQIGKVAKSLSGVGYQFAAHVLPYNSHAVKTLDSRGRGVAFFATVKLTDPNKPGVFIAQLAGRGYDVSVRDLGGGKWREGQQCLVLGVRAAVSRDMERAGNLIHHVEAGVVHRVELRDIPPHTALKKIHDLIRYGRQGPDYLRTIRAYAPQLQPLEPQTEGQAQWKKLRLNAHGHQFDAFRFKTPGGDRRDLVWGCAAPANAYASWYITSTKGPMTGFRNFIRIRNYAPPGVEMPKGSTVIFQMLSADYLSPDTEYILWFTFPDTRPAELHVTLRLAPKGSVKNTAEGLRAALRIDPVGNLPKPKDKPEKKKPDTKPPPDPPPSPFAPEVYTPQVAAANRQAAQRVLKDRGRINILFAKGRGVSYRSVQPGQDLPQERFYVKKIQFTASAFGDQENADFSYLAGLTQLEELRLNENFSTDRLIATIPELGALRTFVAKGRGVSDAALARVARFASLEDVVLQGVNVSGEGLLHLKKLPKLGMLYLGHTALLEEDVAALKSIPGLRDLNLFQSKIGDEGIKHLAACHNLQTLTLSYTRITDEGVKHLAGLGRLHALSLQGTQVTDAAAPILAQLAGLERLTLTDTKVTEECLAPLAKRRLKGLWFAGVKLSKSGLEQLAKMKTLELLNIGNTGATVADAVMLQEALPRCRIWGVNGYTGSPRR